MTSETAIKNDSASEIVHNSKSGHARPRYDDVNVPVVVLIGVISAVATFLTIAFVQGLWARWSDAFVDNTPNPVIQETLDSQKTLLTANPETGRLSIDETMKSIAQKYSQPGTGETPSIHNDPTHDPETPAHDEPAHDEPTHDEAEQGKGEKQ